MSDDRLRARVTVTLKEGVLDPQGQAIGRALDRLGFDGVEAVRQGKVIELDLVPGKSRAAAEAEVTQICEQLLANTVIEDYRFELI